MVASPTEGPPSSYTSGIITDDTIARIPPPATAPTSVKTVGGASARTMFPNAVAPPLSTTSNPQSEKIRI